MTIEANLFEFLIKQMPICTQSPVKEVLGRELHRELRAKYKLELGIDLLSDRCDAVFNCKILDSGCIGRPFPKDPQIKDALDTLNVEVSEGSHRGREVYLAKGIVQCSECPYKQSCEVSCPTQESYIRRRVKPDYSPSESMLVPYEDFERGKYKALTSEDVEVCEIGDWIKEELPLDCLSERQREVMEMILYEKLEQKVIAKRLGISRPTVTNHKASALRRLEEFGKARKVISEHGAPSRVRDYYLNNMTHGEIADKYDVERSTITKFLSRWYKNNCT